jgi:hypothetical protein
MRPLRIASIIVASLLAFDGAAAFAAAQATQPHQHDPAHPQGSAQQPDMEACREMMGRHQKMMDEMKAIDAQRDELVTKMNAVQGQAKIDATAAVVNELVEQRRTMRDRMMTMQERMMGHMMGHMTQGQESMAACPMMQQMMRH